MISGTSNRRFFMTSFYLNQPKLMIDTRLAISLFPSRKVEQNTNLSGKRDCHQAKAPKIEDNALLIAFFNAFCFLRSTWT